MDWVEANHKLHENEIDNILYLIFRYVGNWPMRAADKHVVLTLAGDQEEGSDTNEYLKTLARKVSEYLWDHIYGEPDNVNVEDVVREAEKMITYFYTDVRPEDRIVIT